MIGVVLILVIKEGVIAPSFFIWKLITNTNEIFNINNYIYANININNGDKLSFV
jgi:hypothetical protein